MRDRSDHPGQAASDAPWIKRLASAATRYREAILPPRAPALEMYVFGKHPAWRDFIDPSLLPGTPRPFHDFHVRLRAAAESEFACRGRKPLVAAWRNLDTSAVLLILPSRDGADPFTGSTRLSPLFLGSCIRGSLGELFRFSIPRLTSLATYLIQEGRTASQFVNGIRLATKNWTDDFEALCNGNPKPGPKRGARFRTAVDRVWSYEAASPQGCFLLLKGSNLDIAFALKMGAEAIDATDFRTALGRAL